MTTPAPTGHRILVVTAVAAEGEAIARAVGAPDADAGPGRRPRFQTGAGRADVMAGGVGVASSAAATASVLTRAEERGEPFHLVIGAGVGGGFAPVEVGDIVVATAVVQADLGAEDGTGFLSLSQLGLGPERTDLEPSLIAELARRARATAGAVLTVSCATGSSATAHRRSAACPDARAEAMEGAGILAAAALHGLPFAEVRSISNLVGPRDRSAWRLAPALDALGSAIAAVLGAPLSLAVPSARTGHPGSLVIPALA